MNPLELLPDFESFQYQIATRLPVGQLRAWAKLAECERRLALYTFVEAQNDPRKAQYRVFLNDTLSAFLLSLEATLQFLKDQLHPLIPRRSFDNWLSQQPRYDVVLKGLRTLRHLEAHVVMAPPRSRVVLMIGESLPDGTSATNVSRTWHLPELQPSDLGQLFRPALAISDLKDWNVLVAQSDVGDLLEDGLTKLKDILLAAEQVV